MIEFFLNCLVVNISEHSLWNVFTTLQWFLDYLYYMGLGAVTCLRPGSVESSLRTHGMVRTDII